MATSNNFSARFLLIIGLLASQSMAAQDRSIRSIESVRLEHPISVDGQLDDTGWNKVPVAGDFTQLSPHPFESPSHQTHVRFAYDDDALYIGARMWDSAPDSILHQLSQRDRILNADDFGVWFSTFNDGINAVRFSTTPDGVQSDEQLSAGNNDASWDAVWDVACQIDSLGWTAEFRIPWMALRFPESEEQIWGINFYRGIRRLREESVWNPMDPTQETLNQGGVLTGIKGIDPPLRLSLFPYFSSYATASDGEVAGSYNGGLDLKVGLGNAFTLDMTLIPDFGQVVSDNLVLNLSPFEIQFDENRQFFKEGTELFNKSGIVYSRRIGEDAQLLNASKISGRTKGGMGVGILQAFARENADSSMTSYSVAVLDQNLPNNGYVTTTSTLVAREGERMDAWVQAASFEVRDRKNLWSLEGGGALNRKFNAASNEENEGDEGDEGDAWNIMASRMAGKLTYSIGHAEESANFDPNDLGYLEAPNEAVTFGSVSYKIYEPFGRFNRMSWSLDTEYNRIESPRMFNSWIVEARWRATTKLFNTWNVELSSQPTQGNDFFASRIDGLIWKQPAWVVANSWYSSDYRKRLAIDLGGWLAFGALYKDWKEQTIRIAPRIRFNDRLTVKYVWKIIQKSNERGWVDVLTDSVSDPEGPPISLFGQRDNIERTQVLNVNYIFNNRMSLSARVRHSWSQVRYKNSFLMLPESGVLVDTDAVLLRSDGTSEYDVNFNAWSIDLVYRWIFSPGSEINVVWKNNLLQDVQGEVLPNSYRSNFAQMIELGFVNSLSIRAVFFIDYSRFKQGLRGFQDGQ